MKQYSVVIALICAALVGELVAQASRLRSKELKKALLSSKEWTQFKSKYGKSYEDPAEDARRFANFMETKQRVEHHNAQRNRSFTMGLNRMADWTEEERAKLNGFRMDENILNTLKERISQSGAYLAKLLGSLSEPVPDEFDWSKIPGRVGPIKDQGRVCGSCWAFATTGLLEGQVMWSNLSEQQLVDCSKSNRGCDGGWMWTALEDLKDLGGIESSKDYPYTKKNGTCKFNETAVVMKIARVVVMPAEDEDKLKETLFKYGPISVAMNASRLREYTDGVYDKCESEIGHLNHAVLLVGYGVDPQQGDYWMVKNSWGADWGEMGGYFKIKRGVNMCGIALVPTIAEVDVSQKRLLTSAANCLNC